MTDDFQIDARRWRFLDNPSGYIQRGSGGLQIEPLTRQFKTAKEILARLASGRGVLLADDVGLGKTTVGALVAWVVANQDKRIRIYAPNEVLRRRWAKELERHVPMLSQFGASYDRIKQGNVKKLNAGNIQITTHSRLIKLEQTKSEKRTRRTANRKLGSSECDLMIIDEAHRAKGDGSTFNMALHKIGGRAKRKLILTATPFSIRLAELEQLLQFAGATEIKAVRHYAGELKRLYSLGDGGHDVTAESNRLVGAAKEAIAQLQPYLIRHGIDDLTPREQKHFGALAPARWEIPTLSATQEDLELLLRMDRLLQLAPERKGERRNDPRFHLGWQHVGVELERAAERAVDSTARRHIEAASMALKKRRAKPHPKIAAVSDAIRLVLDEGEKVLVFCHHRATASELLGVLERTLKTTNTSRGGPPEKVWRAAWVSLLPKDDCLAVPIIDWLCTPGLRAQIGGWIGEPATTVSALAHQLETTRPRNAMPSVPSIVESARMLMEVMLNQQSTSTRAILKSIANGANTFGGKNSHFPGRLDDGYCVMGAWHHDGHGDQPKTLYTSKPDIVIALFNSPFGPDVLVTTDRLSEGVDLHRCCRHLIHYELDPSPVRTLQRNGRVRRVGSWAALTGQPLKYAYPTFNGTRDEKAVAIMKQRLAVFGSLLGGVPSLDEDGLDDHSQSSANAVLKMSERELARQNKKLTI